MSVEGREVIRELLRKGVNVTPEALELISKHRREILPRLASMKLDKPVLDASDILAMLEEERDGKIDSKMLPETGFDDINVESIPTNLRVKGDISEFVGFVRNRFEKIKSIIAERLQIDPIPANLLKDSSKRSGDMVTIVGMVMEKVALRDRTIRMELDDESGSVTVVVRYDGRRKVWEIADRIPPDSIIAVRGTVYKGRVYAESILLPDINGVPKVGGSDGRVMLISDIHIGSSYFNKEAFERFLRWLGSDQANDVRYLIIGGDLIDGVGIYPDQEEELEIADVDKQFRMASEYLARIPDRIKVILIPGNHEPVSQAEPQPPIQREYVDMLRESRPDLISLPNPAMIRIGGWRFAMYHGRSLNSLFKYIPGLQPIDPARVTEAMSWMLRLRSLAPIYGEHPLNPGEEDYLTIVQPPNLIHTGHVHVYGIGEYKGVVLVNSGTFENETPYIKSMGIRATVGTAISVDLRDLGARLLRFT